MVEKALGDRNETVRKHMLQASVTAVNDHGKVRTLFADLVHICGCPQSKTMLLNCCTKTVLFCQQTYDCFLALCTLSVVFFVGDVDSCILINCLPVLLLFCHLLLYNASELLQLHSSVKIVFINTTIFYALVTWSTIILQYQSSSHIFLFILIIFTFIIPLTIIFVFSIILSILLTLI